MPEITLDYLDTTELTLRQRRAALIQNINAVDGQIQLVAQLRARIAEKEATDENPETPKPARRAARPRAARGK